MIACTLIWEGGFFNIWKYYSCNSIAVNSKGIKFISFTVLSFHMQWLYINIYAYTFII